MKTIGVPTYIRLLLRGSQSKKGWETLTNTLKQIVTKLCAPYFKGDVISKSFRRNKPILKIKPNN